MGIVVTCARPTLPLPDILYCHLFPDVLYTGFTQLSFTEDSGGGVHGVSGAQGPAGWILNVHSAATILLGWSLVEAT